MMLGKGHLLAREAATAADLQSAQRLRWLAFMGKRGAIDDGGATMGWTAVSEVGRGIARRIALAEGVAPPLGA